MEKHNETRKDICNTSKSPRSTPTNSSSWVSGNGNRASSSKSVSSTCSSNKMGYNLRAHLQQIMTFSDDDIEDFEDGSSDDCSIESCNDTDKEDKLHKLGTEEQTDHTKTLQYKTNGQSLVPVNEIHKNGIDVKEDDALDSEEENEIMKEIRNDITNNVRAEMASELELDKAKMAKLGQLAGESITTQDQKACVGNQSTCNKSNPHSDLDDLEPKLRDAIIKMRKLDKILLKRVQKEKEVKRERILLERRIRRELEELHKVKKHEYKEVYANEQKFLALELPARHNEGVSVPDEFTGEEVFTTQLNEDEYPGLCREHLSETTRTTKYHDLSSHNKNRRGDHEGNESVAGETRGVTSDVGGGDNQKSQNKMKKGKDFIKRNKELAADAKNVVTMTEDEKRRLDELLADVDDIPDMPDGMAVDESNPFQLAVKPGEGFFPGEDELQSLTTIDSQLKELLPIEHYKLIASSSLSNIPKVESYLVRRFKRN